MEKIENPLSIDFIAGCISSHGFFSWTHQKGSRQPVFQIKMQANERQLLELIKEKIGLKENIHEYNYNNRHYVVLLVRSRFTIEEIILPTFTGRLFGTKAFQFELWKEILLKEKFKKAGIDLIL